MKAQIFGILAINFALAGLPAHGVAAPECKVKVDGYELEFSASAIAGVGIESKVTIDGETAELLPAGCQTESRPGTTHMRCPHGLGDLRLDVYPQLNPTTNLVDSVDAIFSTPFETHMIHNEDCE